MRVYAVQMPVGPLLRDCMEQEAKVELDFDRERIVGWLTEVWIVPPKLVVAFFPPDEQFGAPAGEADRREYTALPLAVRPTDREVTPDGRLEASL